MSFWNRLFGSGKPTSGQRVEPTVSLNTAPAVNRQDIRALQAALNSLEEPTVGGVKTKEYYSHKALAATAGELVCAFELLERGETSEDPRSMVASLRNDMAPGGKYDEASKVGLSFHHPWSKRLAILNQMLSIVESRLATAQPDVIKASSAPSSATTDWYCADTRDDLLREVIIPLPADSVTETEFGTIMLPADNYPILSMNPWCAGFCSINAQPVAMFRAGEFASAIKQSGVTMAISFCRMPSHPLLLLSIRAESSSLTAAVRAKYGHVPPLTNPIAEWISGLSPHDRELVASVFGSDCFRLVLAEDSKSRNRVYLPDGRVQESAMPRALCEFRRKINGDLRGALEQRWRELLAHDTTISKSRRSFQTASGVELLKTLPTNKDPILPRGT